MVVWGVHSSEWWDRLEHLDWLKQVLSESCEGVASQLEASQAWKEHQAGGLWAASGASVCVSWGGRGSLGRSRYCPVSVPTRGPQGTSCSLIHIGGMCLIPLCDHQNGNRWTGPFLPYFKSNTCPLGEIQTMQKSERKKHSWPQMLLARPNHFGILLFLFPYVKNTGWLLGIQPGCTFLPPSLVLGWPRGCILASSTWGRNESCHL